MWAASGLSWRRGAIGGDRVIEPALILEDVAEIHVGLGIVRLEAQGLLIAGHRLLQLSLLLQGDPQVVVRLGIVRLEAQGLPIAGHRLRQLPLLPQDDRPGCCAPRHSPA